MRLEQSKLFVLVRNANWRNFFPPKGQNRNQCTKQNVDDASLLSAISSNRNKTQSQPNQQFWQEKEKSLNIYILQQSG